MIVHGRERDDVEKQINEEKWQMKNNKMKIKNEMKIQKWNEEQQHHKNLTGGSPNQSNIAGSFCPPFKKMIIEV